MAWDYLKDTKFETPFGTFVDAHYEIVDIPDTKYDFEARGKLEFSTPFGPVLFEFKGPPDIVETAMSTLIFAP